MFDHPRVGSGGLRQKQGEQGGGASHESARSAGLDVRLPERSRELDILGVSLGWGSLERHVALGRGPRFGRARLLSRISCSRR